MSTRSSAVRPLPFLCVLRAAVPSGRGQPVPERALREKLEGEGEGSVRLGELS